jgi:DNA replication protein DnaC
LSTHDEIQAELRQLIEIAAARWVSPPELPPDPIKVRGVPHEHRWCLRAEPDDLKRYADPVAVDRAEALPDVPHMVTLHGEQGSGKSTIGTWLLGRAARSLPRELSYWVSVADLSIAYAEAPSKRACVEADYARGAAVVLLDDLGQEAQTEHARELVADVIARRHARHLMTIVTTGLTSAQIQARYGGGVLRRLTEPGRSHVLGCRGRR